MRDALGLIESRDALKKYTPKMLGNELSHGGPVKCRELRFDVLDRLLAHSNALTAQQKNHWQWLKREWDAKMAEAHNKAWGKEFAEIVNNLLGELEAGNASAVGDFMYNETIRVLSEVPTLQL